MQDRKRLLEEYIKQMKEGLPFAEDFIEGSSDIRNNSLLARNLTEEALAHEVLKSTGVPIPDKGVTRLKKEDFLNRIVNEQYPEITNPNISLGDESSYFKGKTLVDSKGDMIRNVADSLHETGHKFDTEIMKSGNSTPLLSEKELAKIGKTKNLKDADPLEVYELMSKGHHASIPQVREQSYGLSNLKNALKGNKIRGLGLPIVGGLAAAGLSGDAMAAIPVLGEAEDVGMSSQEEKEMLNERDSLVNYANSQAKQDRLNALSKLKGQ